MYLLNRFGALPAVVTLCGDCGDPELKGLMAEGIGASVPARGNGAAFLALSDDGARQQVARVRLCIHTEVWRSLLSPALILNPLNQSNSARDNYVRHTNTYA